MGRRGGGGRSSGGGGGGLFGGRKAAPAPARRRSASTKAAPPPAKKASAPPPAAAAPAAGGGGMLSGLAGTMMSGMAFGTGSAVANRAIDAVAGPRQVEHVQSGNDQSGAEAQPANQYAPAAAQGGPCGDEFSQFNQCVTDQQGNISNCRFFYDVLSQCQENSSADSQWK